MSIYWGTAIDDHEPRGRKRGAARVQREGLSAIQHEKVGGMLSRIHIVGGRGSGKTYLAARLSILFLDIKMTSCLLCNDTGAKFA
jgi:ATP-dependent protease Clp ATPase subunit